MDSLLNTYLTLLKMSENDPRYESMLFNYETTMKHEFRNGAILDAKRTIYQEKPKCLRLRPPPLKDLQTLTDWKNSSVPIDLMVKPKEILRTDPKEIQKPYVPLEDQDKELVRSTRPRLVMPPAVSMDDIENEHQRQLLTKEIYASSAKLAMELGISSPHGQPDNVKAPLPGTLAAANPITIKKLQFPYVAPQWRMRAVSWDARQLRAHCDPSLHFYLGRTLRCKFCEETAARERNRKITKNIKRNVQSHS